MNTLLECTNQLAQTAVALIGARTRQDIVNTVHEKVGASLKAAQTRLILWEPSGLIRLEATGPDDAPMKPRSDHRTNLIELRLFRKGLIDGRLELDLEPQLNLSKRLWGVLTLLADAVTDALGKLEQDRIKHDEWHSRYVRLEELALEDELTGLGNRRAFNQALARQAALAERAGHDVALAVIDLDGLKRINDAHGHERGDQLLRVFSGALETRMRRSDTLYRFGGDEFAVIMPNLPRGANHVLDHPLRHALAAMHNRGFVQASASTGITWLSEAISLEAVVRLADERMYLEKHARSASMLRPGAGNGVSRASGSWSPTRRQDLQETR